MSISCDSGGSGDRLDKLNVPAIPRLYPESSFIIICLLGFMTLSKLELQTDGLMGLVEFCPHPEKLLWGDPNKQQIAWRLLTGLKSQ